LTTDDGLKNAKLVSPSINCDWFTGRHLCGLYYEQFSLKFNQKYHIRYLLVFSCLVFIWTFIGWVSRLWMLKNTMTKQNY